MGFSLDISVPAITVFFQGLISFFSPCVLPLIPLYIGYLSGGTGTKGEDGRIYYKRSKVMPVSYTHLKCCYHFSQLFYFTLHLRLLPSMLELYHDITWKKQVFLRIFKNK